MDDYSTFNALNRTWCLYFSAGKAERNKSKASEWKAYEEIASFSTAEGFWRLFENIVHPSGLQGASKDYFLFEEGIRPDWDDEGNVNGGLWLAHSSGAVSTRPAPGPGATPAAKSTLDTWWLNSVMHVIGEQSPHPDEVVGLSLSLRRNGGRIALWTRNADNEAAQMLVGRAFKSVLQLDEHTTVGFSSWQAIKQKTAAKRFYWSDFRGALQV